MDTVLQIASTLLTVAILLGLWRLARGPTVIDRILAFDLITTCVVGMIVLICIRWNTSIYLELILIFSLLGFCGTVAFVYYLSRTERLDRLFNQSASQLTNSEDTTVLNLSDATDSSDNPVIDVPGKDPS